jgi:hypothetical protein
MTRWTTNLHTSTINSFIVVINAPTFSIYPFLEWPTLREAYPILLANKSFRTVALFLYPYFCLLLTIIHTHILVFIIVLSGSTYCLTLAMLEYITISTHTVLPVRHISAILRALPTYTVDVIVPFLAYTNTRIKV